MAYLTVSLSGVSYDRGVIGRTLTPSLSTGQSLQLYARMARPSQLLSILLVYSWGIVIGLSRTPGFSAVTFFAGLLPLLLVSASIHYANEYADVETDALTVRTPFSGGSGALGDFSAPQAMALRAAWAALIAGVLLAVVELLAGMLSPLAFLILLAGAFGGWMYSVRPLALAWRGWGEVTNAFLGGMLLTLYGYAVQTGTLDWQVVLISLPFALFAFVNLLATTWADRDADRQVGKYTLATRWPVARLRRLYFLAISAAYLLLFLQRGTLLPDFVFWGSLLILPVVLWAGLAYTRQHSPFPSVFIMVLLLLVQLGGWLATVAGAGGF